MTRPIRWRENPREYNRIALRDHNALRRFVSLAEDKCVDCGETAAHQRVRCEECLRISASKQKDKYHARRNQNATNRNAASVIAG